MDNNNYEEVYKQCAEICPELQCIIEYMRHIPPKRNERKKILEEIKNGDKSAEKRFIEIYLRTALRCSLRAAQRSGLPLDDLFSEAVLALMEYTERLSENEISAGNLFIIIKKRLSQYILKNRYPAKVTPKFNMIINQVKLAAQKYGSLYQIGTVKAICSETGITEKDVIIAMQYIQTPLDCNSIDISGSYDVEQIILRKLDMSELHDLVNEILHGMSEKKRIVLEMKYGIDHRQCSVEEIARALNVTIARIYVIRKHALRDLRKPSIYSEKLRQYLDN